MRRSQPRAGKLDPCKGIGRFGKEIEHVLHAGIDLWKSPHVLARGFELDLGQAPAHVSRGMLACGVRPTPKSSSVQRAASRGRARTGALQAERRRMKKVGNILELSATDLSATSTAVSERSSTAWRGGDGTRFCSSRYKVRRWNEGRQIARPRRCRLTPPSPKNVQAWIQFHFP